MPTSHLVVDSKLAAWEALHERLAVHAGQQAQGRVGLWGALLEYAPTQPDRRGPSCAWRLGVAVGPPRSLCRLDTVCSWVGSGFSVWVAASGVYMPELGDVLQATGVPDGVLQF